MTMTHGGGFCERHGPYDPPHTTCPYCALEAQQRLAYGPPEATVHTAATAVEPADDSDFARYVAVPRLAADETEALAQDAAERLPDAEDATAADGEALTVPLAWLIVKAPPAHRGAVLPVQPNQVIGREGDIRWDDPSLSRQHARFTLEPPADQPDSAPLFHIWPFGPTHPVYVNGQPVRGATPLQENDEIRLGETLFVFKVLWD